MTDEQAAVRTRNAAATRVAILRAAHERFLTDGYDQVGVRAIASRAGIDPALICRYFGSKEQLFAEVLEGTSKDPMQVLAGDRATFGTRVARAVLDPADRTPERLAFIQLATRAGASPVASRLVRRHVENQFIMPFAQWLGDAHAAEKAWLTACVLMGVVAMAGIECATPAPEETEAAVARLASVLQGIIDERPT